MKRKRWSLAVLLAATVALPGSARSKLEPPELGLYLRWGALRVRPRLELTHFGYDNNILASTSNEVADLTATVSPTLEGLLLFGRRAFLTFNERIEFTFFRDNSDQNFRNQIGSGRLTVPFGRFGVFTDVVYNRVLLLPIDLQDTRAERQETALDFGAIIDAGWRSEIELSVGKKRWRYEDPDFSSLGQTIGERLDRNVDTTKLGADYLLIGRTSLTLDAQIATIDFISPDPLGRSKDSDSWSILPGLNFGQKGSLSGSLRLGWGVVDAQDPTRPDLAEIVGDANVAYRASRATTIRLDTWRRPGFSLWGTSTYYVDRRVRVGLLRYFNAVFGIDATVGTGRLTFPGTGGLEREDEIWEYDVGVRVRLAENSIGRRVEYSLKVLHRDVESTIPTLDRSRTRLDLGAVVGF